MRWFFSSTLVYILSQSLRFVGGVAFLFYLEWRLAIAALVALPGMVVGVRYFSNKTRILSHQRMEQQANISRRVQESLSATALIKAFASEKRTIGRLTSELRAALQISLEQTTVSSIANLAINTLPDVARIFVLVAGAYWVIRESGV
ncbi:MAG: ABC transporter ATP-binding protein [Anaerolineales bacterium]